MSACAPRSVEQLTDIYGMRVIVRTSLDVPIEDGVAPDHFRIRQAIPTLTYLIERGARVILLTHVGRDPQNSTKPLRDALEKYIPITYTPGLVGEEVFGAVAHMKEGTVLLLENLRSHEGEESNDEALAKELASYGDFYVNDAFAVAHRAHASIVGIPKFLPSFGGITFMKEYGALSKAFAPEQPSLFILGGAKFETKEPLIDDYNELYTHTFIGGALANDFLKGKGCEVGKSLLSPVDMTTSALLHNPRVVLPVDVVVHSDGVTREVSISGVLTHETIVDAGPKTLDVLAPLIKDAKTILWNGPLGNYEGGFDAGTKALACLVAGSDAFSIVGGGDTVASIETLGLQDSFGFLSTAGGAMLEFLEKKTLPGIDALCGEWKSV